MVTLLIHPSHLDPATAQSFADCLQAILPSKVYFATASDAPARTPSTAYVSIYVTECEGDIPFSVGRESGVTISTFQLGGIARFANVEEGIYLAICALLGLTQWRALALNPLLKVEDFDHPEDEHCLFRSKQPVHDYTLLLEAPRVCTGCRDFYHSLGADSEIIALDRLIRDIRCRANS